MSGYDQGGRREQPSGSAPYAGPMGGSVGGATPTAEELMMYADGELEPHRAAQVAYFIRTHPEAQARLAGADFAARLLVGGMLSRAQAAGADGIADAIMASLADEPHHGTVTRLRSTRGRGRWVARASVTISLTLAVAAAALIWGRSILRHKSVAQLAAIGSGAASSGAGTSPDPMSAIGAPIKIDAVDFGARAGTIFYIKTEDDKSSTPVLWVNDDDAGDGGGRK